MRADIVPGRAFPDYELPTTRARSADSASYRVMTR